jgi:hypothetical protein
MKQSLKTASIGAAAILCAATFGTFTAPAMGASNGVKDNVAGSSHMLVGAGCVDVNDVSHGGYAGPEQLPHGWSYLPWFNFAITSKTANGVEESGGVFAYQWANLQAANAGDIGSRVAAYGWGSSAAGIGQLEFPFVDIANISASNNPSRNTGMITVNDVNKGAAPSTALLTAVGTSSAFPACRVTLPTHQAQPCKVTINVTAPTPATPMGTVKMVFTMEKPFEKDITGEMPLFLSTVAGPIVPAGSSGAGGPRFKCGNPQTTFYKTISIQ